MPGEVIASDSTAGEIAAEPNMETPVASGADDDARLVLAAVGRMQDRAARERASLERLRLGLAEMADAIVKAKTSSIGGPNATEGQREIDATALLDEFEHLVDAMIEIAGGRPPAPAARTSTAAETAFAGETTVPASEPAPEPPSALQPEPLPEPFATQAVSEADQVPTVSGVVSRLDPDRTEPESPALSLAALAAAAGAPTVEMLKALVEALNAAPQAASAQPSATHEPVQEAAPDAASGIDAPAAMADDEPPTATATHNVIEAHEPTGALRLDAPADSTDEATPIAAEADTPPAALADGDAEFVAWPPDPEDAAPDLEAEPSAQVSTDEPQTAEPYEAVVMASGELDAVLSEPPAETMVAETMPAETMPAETMPAETMPAETMAADALPPGEPQAGDLVSEAHEPGPQEPGAESIERALEAAEVLVSTARADVHDEAGAAAPPPEPVAEPASAPEAAPDVASAPAPVAGPEAAEELPSGEIVIHEVELLAQFEQMESFPILMPEVGTAVIFARDASASDAVPSFEIAAAPLPPAFVAPKPHPHRAPDLRAAVASAILQTPRPEARATEPDQTFDPEEFLFGPEPEQPSEPAPNEPAVPPRAALATRAELPSVDLTASVVEPTALLERVVLPPEAPIASTPAKPADEPELSAADAHPPRAPETAGDAQPPGAAAEPAPHDPLLALKAMTLEERIALFS